MSRSWLAREGISGRAEIEIDVHCPVGSVALFYSRKNLTRRRTVEHFSVSLNLDLQILLEIADHLSKLMGAELALATIIFDIHGSLQPAATDMDEGLSLASSFTERNFPIRILDDLFRGSGDACYLCAEIRVHSLFS